MLGSLYQDERIKIEHIPQFHERYMITIDGEKVYYLPRRALRDVALAHRERLGGALHFISDLVHHVEDNGIGLDGLHIALLRAYLEEELDYYRNCIRKMR